MAETLSEHDAALASSIRPAYRRWERITEAGDAPARVDLADTARAEFSINPGVGQLGVSGVTPGDHLSLCVPTGERMVTLIADSHGQASFGYLPDTHGTYQTGAGIFMELGQGSELIGGPFVIVNESTTPPQASAPISPLDVSDVGDPARFNQPLTAGFGYLEMRDGVKLSAMVQFPPEQLYGPGPYPTLVEYSGYKPSHPEGGGQTSLIGPLLGFAVVGVNMRGTGASGGVYDVFSRANQADGYDIIEIVGRQEWCLHHHVGMVGVSYPGISQLITASTRPPSLAAICPMSVVDDAWRQQWPGGVYNNGFTREWLHTRDQAAFGGEGWELAIAETDPVCADNLKWRGQDVDFELMARSIEFYSPTNDLRRMKVLSRSIEVPVFLCGAWQDEQTGSRFATMLDDLSGARVLRATMYNGHHPDSLNPALMVRWYEFLSFFVAKRVPKVNEMVRAMAPGVLADAFKAPADLEGDRFEHFGDDFDAALAAYLEEPPIRLIFESGLAGTVPGAFGGTFELSSTSFPVPGARVREWFAASDHHLVDHPVDASSSVEIHFDAEAGSIMTFDPESGGDAYDPGDMDRFTPPFVPHTWTASPDGTEWWFDTDPLTAPVTISGPGHLELWCAPGSVDAAVQVLLTEVTADGTEIRVQAGWLRLGHSCVDVAESTEVWPEYTFAQGDFVDLTPGQPVCRKIPIYPVSHAFRTGSKIRVAVKTPGRDNALWAFESPEAAYGEVTHTVLWGGQHQTVLRFPTLAVEVPDITVDRTTLRGQPTRPDPHAAG